MIKIRKIALLLSLLLTVFLLSGCIYQQPTEQASYVPASDIVQDNGQQQNDAQQEQAQGASPEAQQIIDSLMERMNSSDKTAEQTAAETNQVSADAQQTADMLSEGQQANTTATQPTQEPSADATVIVKQETDKVSLVPKASDPDGDSLVFTFTSPLDQNGEWQTTYGDQGEYTVTVTASDGQLTTSKDVLLIINKKEEQPTIDFTDPSQGAVSLKETDSQDFSIKASDLNKDPLTFTWKLDGVTVGSGNSFLYQTSYDDAGSHTIKVDVSDGTSTVSNLWSVEVANLNRAPSLEPISDITVKENEAIDIEASASDPDGDPLTYSIDDSRFEQDDNKFTWKTDYNSAGVYTVTLSVNDGTDTSSQQFTVTVENVNRQPVIQDIVAK